MLGLNFCVPLTGLVYVDDPCGSSPCVCDSQASIFSRDERAAEVMSVLVYVPSMAIPTVPELNPVMCAAVTPYPCALAPLGVSSAEVRSSAGPDHLPL